MTMRIVLLEGDQTGQELLQDAIRVLEPDLIGLPITFDRHDLSLEARPRTKNGVVREAADALRAHRYGIKAATITPEAPDDAGSPNALLR
jgi:isocitrate dehydrogenase